MANQATNDTCCPFWDKHDGRTCQLVESGLYIPTQEHILHFCKTESYVACDHFVGKSFSRQIPFGISKDKPINNRRLFTRIPTSQKISVSSYSMAKKADEDLLDDQAMTVDLSLGGIQIETNAPIYVNQIVSFSFDEYFHPPGFKGKGEIRWIHQDKSQDSPSHAGLAFVDNETANTVKNHLMGMGEKLLRLSGF